MYAAQESDRCLLHKTCIIDHHLQYDYNHVAKTTQIHSNINAYTLSTQPIYTFLSPLSDYENEIISGHYVGLINASYTISH